MKRAASSTDTSTESPIEWFAHPMSWKKYDRGKETPLNNDEVWWTSDVHDSVDPWDAWYGKFDSASPFKENVDFEPRRRIIVLNRYLDPDTTTWYGLWKQYVLLMRPRRQEERHKELKQRIIALGLDPKMEQYPGTHRIRALAFEFEMNPSMATWEDVASTNLELHKVVLSEGLAWRAGRNLDRKVMNFENLLQRALEYYLDSHEDGVNTVDDEQPIFE